MKHVAIVGAGLAGLSSAFRLHERGVHCTVFEAMPTAGGRCAAATYLLGPEAYRNTFRLAATLGLQNELIGIPPVAGQFYKGNVYHHSVSSVMGLLKFKGLNVFDKALLSRMAYLLARYSSSLDFHHPEKGIALDDETVASFVKRELSQNILNYVAGPLISTLFYYSSEETSKLLYLNLAKYMHNTTMYTIRGGLNRLIEQLRLAVRVQTTQPVLSIEPSGDGYRLNGSDFSDVVFAIPGTAVMGIEGLDVLLSAEDRQFFTACRYGRAVTVSMAMDGPVDRCYALSIPRVEKLRAATIIHHDFIDPEGDSKVTVIGGGDAVTAAELLEDFVTIYRKEPRSTEVREWRESMPKFPPGRFREIAEFKSRPRRPGLFFCGDYLMGPFVESAITTGLEAADSL